jgi:hypothetical protein
MIRKSLTLILILCIAPWGHAITHLTINDVSHYSVTSLPAEIVLSSDAVSIGNTISCELFLDVNENKRILDSSSKCNK